MAWGAVAPRRGSAGNCFKRLKALKAAQRASSAVVHLPLPVNRRRKHAPVAATRRSAVSQPRMKG
eukprot:1972208-Alexandrium_andersonii.AAC.1